MFKDETTEEFGKRMTTLSYEELGSAIFGKMCGAIDKQNAKVHLLATRDFPHTCVKLSRRVSFAKICLERCVESSTRIMKPRCSSLALTCTAEMYLLYSTTAEGASAGAGA
jgi:hypothetical protein